jgi:hypothetical protein
MPIETDTRNEQAGSGSSFTRMGGVDRRDRDLQLREGFLPERRKLVTVLIRDPNTGDARCSIFPDVEFAERFIRATIKLEGRQAFLAYWTLGEEPDLPQLNSTGRQAKVVVVSRSGEELGLVKPLTFADMEAARVYFESDREREIAAIKASVFWALPLQIRQDAAGAVRLSSPPGALHQESDQLEHSRASLLNTRAERDPGFLTGGGQIMSVRSVLSVARWPTRGPGEFKGFQSPRGKF